MTHHHVDSNAPVKETTIPEKLLSEIASILLRNGIKATSMDFLASSLKMSKRTLYELFESKADMTMKALKHIHEKVEALNKKHLDESDNVLEAIYLGFKTHRDVMAMANADFLRDIKEFNDPSASHRENMRGIYLAHFTDMLRAGVEQELFHKDINLDVAVRMLTIYMESLKFSEKIFPPGITLLEAYDNMGIMFLRGISTVKGINELEKLMERFPIAKSLNNIL